MTDSFNADFSYFALRLIEGKF